MSEKAATNSVIGRKIASETGATLLMAGGLFSAFGAASCCALPMVLGSLGLAGAWFGSLALLTGPHRPALLVAAVIGLAGGGGVLLRQHPARALCAPGSGCVRPMSAAVIMGALFLGAVLTILGFVFA
jgi:mercuric ion transport protein